MNLRTSASHEDMCRRTKCNPNFKPKELALQ